MIESLQALDKKRPIHCIGIGGCGMSGIALGLRRLGYNISGSDVAESATTQILVDNDILVRIGQNGGNIPPNTQIVVASAAIAKENPELMAAQARGIPVVKYANMLGLMMQQREGIAVAGTHGKTTTTAMIAVALQQLGHDPDYVIGGTVPQLGGSARLSDARHLVVEACEFDRSFHQLLPRYAIINNIEEDHLDYYNDLDEIVESFRQFTQLLPPDGFLVHSVSSNNTRRLLDSLPCRAVTTGLETEADYSAHDIRFADGVSRFRLESVKHGRPEEEVVLQTFGRHNVINALQAIALLTELGNPLADVIQAVGAFRGVHRRFEILSRAADITIVDDYAHHPTEIRTVLRSSKDFFPGRRIVGVFQPHQHSRTRFLMKDFAASFEYADLLVVPDIYFVRDSEEEKELVHARDLVRAILAKGGNAVYLPSFGEITQFLRHNLNPGDVCITMGAGNVWEIAHELKKNFQPSS